MDREPRSAPFQIGARVRYIGPAVPEDAPLCSVRPGTIFEIVDVVEGRQGTGEVDEETGAVDETTDHQSVREQLDEQGRLFGVCIHPRDVGVWELIEPARRPTR